MLENNAAVRQTAMQLISAANLVIDRVYSRGQARAVFLKDGRLVDFPVDGARAQDYLRRDGRGVTALGVYDHDATVDHILEDIGIA